MSALLAQAPRLGRAEPFSRHDPQGCGGFTGEAQGKVGPRCTKRHDWGSGRIASIQKFSSQVIDYARQLSTRWQRGGKHPQRTRYPQAVDCCFPLSGAALYAARRSDVLAARPRESPDEAKARASELPDDLLSRVQQTSVQSSSQNGGQRSGFVHDAAEDDLREQDTLAAQGVVGLTVR